MNATEQLAVYCRNCGRNVRFPEKLAGQKRPCPGCNEELALTPSEDSSPPIVTYEKSEPEPQLTPAERNAEKYLQPRYGSKIELPGLLGMANTSKKQREASFFGWGLVLFGTLVILFGLFAVGQSDELGYFSRFKDDNAVGSTANSAQKLLALVHGWGITFFGCAIVRAGWAVTRMR
jgi:hypothetical protein